MTRSLRRGLAIAMSSALVMVAGSACQADKKSNAPGVTDDTITLGALSTLTGTFAAGAKSQLAGAQLFWKGVNANGGVCDGRSVKIVARDNKYDPQTTVSDYNNIKSKVLALQLITGTAMTQAIVPQMKADKVSSIPMSWSPDLLDKSSVIVPGTTYDVDMMNGVDHLIETGVLKSGDRIGYAYFQGDFGSAGLAGAEAVAKKHGIHVSKFQIDPNSTDLSAQMSQMGKDNVKAIFMSVSPPLLANAAALEATNHLDVPIVVPTPTFVPQLLKSPSAKQIAKHVIVVSPYNAWSGKSKGLNKLRAEFAKGSSGDKQQFFIAGYAAAQLMKDALVQTCKAGPLTRENLQKQFAKVKQFDLDGLSVPLNYSDRSVPPNLSDYLLKVDPKAPGGLTPIQTEPYKGPDAAPLLKGKA